MKRFHKLGSVLTAVAVGLCAAASVLSASAAVTISDGTFEYTYNNGAWTLYSYVGEETTVSLPQSYADAPVTGIANECFSQTNVTSVTIPQGYTTIGNYAFYRCENLESISLPDTVSSVGMGAFAESGITSADLSATKLTVINPYLFLNCSALESVLLPQGITVIGEAAFAESAIESIDIPGSVTELQRAAFANTDSLETVSVHEGLRSIGESCFENSSLSHIRLPETLETIGDSALRSDMNLKQLYIPDSVNSIGAYALYPMSIQSSIEVICFKESYADTYCYENFVRNTTVYDKLYGDVNLDGRRNVNDVAAIQRICAEVNGPKVPGDVLADTNHDGIVSIVDATLLQRFLAEFDDAII